MCCLAAGPACRTSHDEQTALRAYGLLLVENHRFWGSLPSDPVWWSSLAATEWQFLLGGRTYTHGLRTRRDTCYVVFCEAMRGVEAAQAEVLAEATAGKETCHRLRTQHDPMTSTVHRGESEEENTNGNENGRAG